MVAPVGGVNARDALAAMPPTDAISMTNWFPQPSFVGVRLGSQNWATGMPAAVETIMPYNGETAYKNFAASSSGIYDVTGEGAVGSAVVTGLSNARWQEANFNAGGGNVLLAVNGADAPQRFDNNVQGSVELLGTLTPGTGYTNGTYTAVAFTGGSGSGAKATIVVTGQGITATGSLAGGSSYTNGTYTNVPLTGGFGTGALATVTIAGAVVTAVTITQGGTGYHVADVLSATAASLGGTGSGFTINVTAVSSGTVTAVTVTTVGTGYHVGDVLSATAATIGGSGSGFSVPVSTVGGWSTTTISGTNTLTGLALNPNNLITVTSFKARLWFIEKASMNCWYTGTSAYQGPLTLLPLGALFKKGGYLMQMASWTIDNVSGINDYAAFITSEGEVAIYQGYDPGTLATWSLVGTFVIGRPIGRRCIQKFGADVLCITTDGLVPLSQALLTDRLQPDIYLTDKIRNAINLDVQDYGDNFGWQVVEHPIGSKLILNVPEVTDSTSHQWVMNTSTAAKKAWTTFENWNAACWAVQQDNLYYGGAGTVVLADTGYSDAGKAITVDCKPAFGNFGDESLKIFEMARPIFRVSAPIAPTITLNIDFEDVKNAAPLFTQGLQAPWNTSPWNTTPWGGIYPLFLKKDWIGIAGEGYWASGRLSFQVKNVSVEWMSTDYMYGHGGPI